MRFFLFTFFLILSSLLGCSVAVKNPECGLPHSKRGGDKIVCMAYMPMYSYDSGSKKCVEFIYGGCGGNGNRFGRKEDCEMTCLE